MPGRLFPKPFEGQSPQEFGIGANILKTRTFDLTNARDLEQVEIGGSCIWAMAATSLTASIDVRINDQLRDPLTFQQGMFIRGIPFSRVYVSHAAQVGATITLFFAVEEDVRNIEIINPSTQFNNVNIGNISQDDSWMYETLQKRAFMGSAYDSSDGIDTTVGIELWNPAASGKNLFCTYAIVMSNCIALTHPLHIGHHNVALPDAGVEGNKWLSEAGGVGDMNCDNYGAFVGTDIAQIPVQPNIYIPIPFDPPILIDPGTGLIFQITDDTKILSVCCQWIELNI